MAFGVISVDRRSPCSSMEACRPVTGCHSLLLEMLEKCWGVDRQGCQDVASSIKAKAQAGPHWSSRDHRGAIDH